MWSRWGAPLHLLIFNVLFVSGCNKSNFDAFFRDAILRQRLGRTLPSITVL
jgi:hypothetical protein